MYISKALFGELLICSLGFASAQGSGPSSYCIAPCLSYQSGVIFE